MNHQDYRSTIKMLAAATMLAAHQHTGQRDKGGNHYFEHVFVVANNAGSIAGPSGYTVGMLHDVLEDTPLMLDELIEMGFPSDITDAVFALTRQEGESWDNYLARVKKNDLARVVKLCDLTDNSDHSRLNREPTEKDIKRAEKYQNAITFLMATEGEPCAPDHAH